MLGRIAYKIFCRPAFKRILEPIPVIRRLYNGWAKTHPFDVAHGTDTSGYITTAGITDDASLQQKINAYAASQPTIVRKALGELPNLHEYSFIDIGCGKGRATMVASEFPFQQVVGVELSSKLATIARTNHEAIKTRYPDRSPISIIEGNALKCPLPKGKVVLFLCHSFGPELLAELIKTIEKELEAGSIEHFFFVYDNPVHGDLLDACPALTRWYAGIIPYDESEIGYGPDLEDAVVIWQSRRGAQVKPRPRAERQIIIKKALWTAGLAKIMAALACGAEEMAVACMMGLPI